MKAQVSVELLLILVLFLGVITPLFYFTFSQSADEIKLSKAEHALDSIAKSADYVYSLDEGTKTQIEIELPDGILNSTISGKTIAYNIETRSGTTDVFSISISNLYGALPVKSSAHIVTLEHTDTGVRIG
jgi:uncharacterized protein (UPF0333 family)